MGGDQTSPEMDDPSDCCDFGYVLALAIPKLAKDSYTEKRFVQDRPFDPADHWGKEI